MVWVALPEVPLRLSNVIQMTPWLSPRYGSPACCTYVPGLGKLVTLDHVAPKSVLRHRPLPLGVPRYSTLSLFGSIASRSPMPRPGMLPPSLNGSGVSVHVSPLSVERRMAPLLGSQLLVYMPAARYTRLVCTGSVARLTTPL